MSLLWDQQEAPYEYTGGRCLCDDCCRAQPERLQERIELARGVFRRYALDGRQKRISED